MFKTLRNMAFLVTTVLIPYAHGDIYSWVDSHGCTHFSESSIEGATIVQVKDVSASLSLAQVPATNSQSQDFQNKNTGLNSHSGENHQMPVPDGDMSAQRKVEQQ